MKDLRVDRMHTQLDAWPRDMRRVRRSAFGNRQLPRMLCRVPCWIVRAKLGRKLVGYAWAYDLSDKGTWAVIDDVAVHASLQSRGVGDAMVAELVPWLEAEGFTDITGMATNGRMQRIFDQHSVSLYPRSMFDLRD